MLLVMLYIINFVLALFLIFYMEKDAGVTWAWLLILLFLPILGFLLFLLFGYGLNNKEKDIIKNVNETTLKELNSFLCKNKKVYDESEEAFLKSLNHLPISIENEITIITDGQEKLHLLKRDLKNATRFIYIQYYAFLTDETGISILEILEKQAKKGVSVKLLYDKLGSKGVKKELFTPLIKAGGEVSTFLTSQNAAINFGMNYHNHRKIAVIDDDLSYIGGFNIADQYVKETKRFGY